VLSAGGSDERLGWWAVLGISLSLLALIIAAVLWPSAGQASAADPTWSSLRAEAVEHCGGGVAFVSTAEDRQVVCFYAPAYRPRPTRKTLDR